MLLKRLLAYNISLLRSSSLFVPVRIYKHSAPPELKRLVASVVCSLMIATQLTHKTGCRIKKLRLTSSTLESALSFDHKLR